MKHKRMKFNIPILIALLIIGASCKTNEKTKSAQTAGQTSAIPPTKQEKFRVMMISDFPPVGVAKSGDHLPNTMKSDPDDMQSIVRFLLYANEFDIEGLIASAGTFAMVANKENVLEVLDRYDMVYKNLKTYDPSYPTPDYLRSVTFEGLGNNHGLRIKWGHNKQAYDEIIGEGLDSEASEAIIAAADKPDPRPIWIPVWGGPREVAQAIWKVKHTRSEKEVKAFISKLRIYLITRQDATHDWLLKEFPELFIIESVQTYKGIMGGKDTLSDLDWVNKNIRYHHGPLCEIYPHEGIGNTGVCEGDSPSFLYLISANRGISDAEDPTQASWGGQYVRIEGTNHFVDGPGSSSVSKWHKDYQAEFRDRADWCIRPKNAPPFLKPRIINTTDLGADPDDEQSLVRQLVSANEFDIEGLIVATGCWKKEQHHTDMLDKIVNAYTEVYPNLSVHSTEFPTPEYLKSISVMGQRGYGMSDVGPGKDSPGSDLIIAAVDKDDPRPVWVAGWGGMNTIAQAIWKVRETRTKSELDTFLRKIRLFDILGQDDAGAWIAKTFPNVFYIRATEVYGWQPSDAYLDEHIQHHGPMGAVYPDRKWATEGDSPAFMHVFPNGLNDPEQIDQGGWGGRFSFTKKRSIRSMSEVAKINKEAEPQYDPYFMFGNTEEGTEAIKKWSTGYNNDFAARMDWSITKRYEDANHHPVAVLNGDKTREVLEMSASAGSTVALHAAASKDPDDNALSYDWSFYEPPSSYTGSVSIQDSTSISALLKIPQDAANKTLHIILNIRDNGSPSLSAYRRIIIKVEA